MTETDETEAPDLGPRGPYVSPLRARQKEQTTYLILDAVAAILRRSDIHAVTIAEVARVSEITERTIYRHFPTREDLLRAFWTWELHRKGGEKVTTPESLDALQASIRRLFAQLDTDEGIIRAMIATPEGRDIRSATNRDRLEHMLAFLRPLLPSVPDAELHEIASGIVSVSSVMSWLFMRDNCGYDGMQAGNAAARTVQLIIDGARARSSRSAQ